jgi:NitT/TauT family transport system ATP-binding protein
METKIKIENLTAEYADKDGVFTALDGVSLDIFDGEFVSIIGSSGSGKSTLLGILQGLIKPTGGTASIDGKVITGPGIDRATVFQHYSLFPWMTIRRNIAFGLKQKRKNLTRKERYDVADDYLKKVGLEGFGQKYLYQLSGGMQQRAAIAGALAMETDILLMDEPFGALDPKNRSVMQELLLNLWDSGEKRKTVVFVTHDIDEAIFLSDKIYILSGSPGKVAGEFKVNFPRPRIHSALRETNLYLSLRSKLMAVFYEDNAGLLSETEYTI